MDRFDEYEKEIDKMANILIGKDEEEKGYPSLKQILRNYDYFVKKGNCLESSKLPYWCVCCCNSFNDKKGDNDEKI